MIGAIAVALSLAGIGAASAQAAPLCTLSPGPWQYQATLGPLLSDPGPPLPVPPGSPPLPAPRNGPGAYSVARAALGVQFGGGWVSNAVQGWVVGLAPGPLDVAAARGAIIDRLGPAFTPSEAAYLAELLYVDPQSYSEAELRATQAAVSDALSAAQLGVGWGANVGLCTLSDARRVEVTLYVDATPEIVERVRALLAPHGDKVRLAVSPHGPPMPVPMPAPAGPLRPASAAAVALGRHVTMPLARRCVRGKQLRVGVRRGASSVRALTVTVGDRERTIRGARLRKPFVVALGARRTKVAVTVRLADGRAATRSVTYVRCR